MQPSYKMVLIGLGLVFLVVATLSLCFGEIYILPSELMKSFSSSSEFSQLILNFRLPKTLTAIIVGIALSISGLLMQTLFRNPVAGPYVLGISSGASLGASVAIMGGTIIGFSNSFSMITGALLGSIAMMFVLLFILKLVQDIMTLLIIGIMFGAFASSLSAILQYFGSSYQVKSFVVWTFGNISNVNFSQLLVMSIFVILALILIIFSLKGLNVLTLGHQNLSNFGISRNRLQISILLSTAILTGVVTAYCGPIGFIGVVVPHFAKMLIKTSNHIRLIPVTALLGAILMLLSDLLSQLPPNGMLLPINSVTAFIGIPFILWILLKPSNKIKI